MLQFLQVNASNCKKSQCPSIFLIAGIVGRMNRKLGSSKEGLPQTRRQLVRRNSCPARRVASGWNRRPYFYVRPFPERRRALKYLAGI